MHIEISKNYVTGLQNSIINLNNAIESTIKNFENVKGRASTVPGGSSSGNIAMAVSNLSGRINRERRAKTNLQTTKQRLNSFLETTISVERSVISRVAQNHKQFLNDNLWARPVPAAPPIPWYKRLWGTIKETASKVWNGVVSFYEKHKKVINTIVTVVLAVAAVAAVVATGGAALAPMIGAGLTALGVSAGTALAVGSAISLTVAGIAVVSTVGATVLNVMDIWGGLNSPALKTLQKVLNITSAISNTLYSVGMVYNSIKSFISKRAVTLADDVADDVIKGVTDDITTDVVKGVADDIADDAVKESVKIGTNDVGSKVVFGSETKSATKLAKQMADRGWTENAIRTTANNPFTTRVSTNLATGNPATVYYNQSGGYVIIDDITNAVVQISDNVNPSAWIPDSNIINPYKP